MKVKDLVREIERCKAEYGVGFLEWEVYSEQCDESDKDYKRKAVQSKGNGWGTVKDSEDWEYFECAGFWTKMPKEKIFTINVNY